MFAFFFGDKYAIALTGFNISSGKIHLEGNNVAKFAYLLYTLPAILFQLIKGKEKYSAILWY